ncbi:hypothetical protein [Falsihalocynthiibacter arcticus]|uniref:Uncharacterized protein n=1 Tax=Falsihalocynthiibacter arcticus TaxID=1579316 RepID=A0A126V463_9RHOB|nr:hypothetical protein [Falsihalocynthiibacter arcticus]AML52745.1 hypothetical protein RC74_17090 [Falsihalocynthiibacter arcticus]
MSAEFERQMKKLAGDGPAERQILLLKLQYEFENSPNFGNRYVGDASSPAQLWIARIGALLSRVSLEHKIQFRTQVGTSVQFWVISMDGLRRALSAAIEEIKLELELDGRDDIGQVYAAGKEYDFFTDLRGIFASAENELFLVDAYFDGASFEAYFSAVSRDLSIRILCGSYARDIAAYIDKFSLQTGAKIEIRKTKLVHDRVVFLDGSDCWLVGASIKDAGKKPTYLIPLAPQISPQKLSIYEGVWSSAVSISLKA